MRIENGPTRDSSDVNFRPKLAFVWPLAPIPSFSSCWLTFPLSYPWRIVLRRYRRNAPSHTRTKVKPSSSFLPSSFTREPKKRRKTFGDSKLPANTLNSVTTSGVRTPFPSPTRDHLRGKNPEKRFLHSGFDTHGFAAAFCEN